MTLNTKNEGLFNQISQSLDPRYELVRLANIGYQISQGKVIRMEKTLSELQALTDGKFDSPEARTTHNSANNNLTADGHAFDDAKFAKLTEDFFSSPS